MSREQFKPIFERAAKLEGTRERLDAVCNSGVTFYLGKELNLMQDII